jgi:hypothetical protein
MCQSFYNLNRKEIKRRGIKRKFPRRQKKLKCKCSNNCRLSEMRYSALGPLVNYRHNAYKKISLSSFAGNAIKKTKKIFYLEIFHGPKNKEKDERPRVIAALRRDVGGDGEEIEMGGRL